MMYFQTIINTTCRNNCCQWNVGQKKIFAFVLSGWGNALWISLEKFDLSVRYYKLLQSLQLTLQTLVRTFLSVCWSRLLTLLHSFFVVQSDHAFAVKYCAVVAVLNSTNFLCVTPLETTLLLIYFVSISHHSNVLNGFKFLFIILLAQQYVQKTFDHGVVCSNFVIVIMERKCMDQFDDVAFL